MEHKGTKVIETERLILRLFRMEDAEMMYRNWASDPEVTKYLTWPTHSSVDETRRVLADWISKNTGEKFYQWAIELKEIGEPIGSIAVVKLNEAVAAAEIGYCIGGPWWGRGIMPEALKAVISYLFDEVGMNRIAAYHDVRNLKSGRVMQKAGMTREGILRCAGRNNQGIVDEVWYSVLKNEYDSFK